MRRRWFARNTYEIAPEDIFLDSSNLPEYEKDQFEGRVAPPVSIRAVLGVGIAFLLIALTFSTRAFYLEVAHGDQYSNISRNNRLEKSLVFATRGIIYDRTGTEIAWNEPQLVLNGSGATTTATSTYAVRQYTSMPGLSHPLGYVQYPKADPHGNWWREAYAGVSGIEYAFDSILSGQNGSTMTETDARGHVERQDIVVPPSDGHNLTLSIDADVQSKLYSILSTHAREQKFKGGAAVIMDVETGELIAMTSFPEYDHQGVVDGARGSASSAFTDPSTPLLNRALAGLYAPGSIVKPIFAAAALQEGIISPDKKIVSVGAITLPNPYDPAHPSIFHDWTVHGAVDMREAIAVSSDEYFYTIGGGYGGQEGLGIARIDQYARAFGLGSTTGIVLPGEQDGVIPTPAWKKEVFGESDPWRIGDTYHTAIGQYGFQITPLQAVRFVAAIANGGKLLTPQLIASSTPQFTSVGIDDSYLEIVREGMRLAVTSRRSDATVKALNMPGLAIAAKTGTAQIGAHNEYMNSWSIGFWPADHPRYAYAVVLERAPAGTLSGAAPGLRPFFEWLAAYHPEYMK